MAETETKAAGGEDQSMEEILQSIRRIIAEENDGDAAPATLKKAEEPAAADVLELTDMVTENGAIINLNEPEVPAEEPTFSGDDDVLKNIDAMIGAPAPSKTDSGDSLISSATAEAASQALKSIRRPVGEHPPAGDGLGFRSGTTVEDLIIEMMKPMLKSWLDANLPVVVERIVEREVRKLTQ